MMAPVGSWTLIATFATPLMFNAVTALAFDTPEAMQALDPARMFGGHLDLTDDLLVSCVIGGTPSKCLPAFAIVVSSILRKIGSFRSAGEINCKALSAKAWRIDRSMPM